MNLVHQFDPDDEGLPKKRFEPDFGDTDFTSNSKLWTPSPEDYELYERHLWQSEFRKLLELDHNSLNNGRQLGVENSVSSSAEYSSDMEDDLNVMTQGAFMDGIETMKINKHPLLIPEIVEKVFNYLDYQHDRETLKNCQFVCSEWRRLCMKRMEQLELDGSFKISSKLSKVKIEDAIKQIPKYCHCFNIKLPASESSTVEKVFETIGPRMKELDICFKIKDKRCSDPQIGHFGDCLEQFCPSLEKLKLWLSTKDHIPDHIFSPDRPHFLPLKQIETDGFVDDGKTEIFDDLIRSSPLLERISFQHEKTEFIVNVLKIIARTRNGLQNLKSLECFHYDLSEDFITFVMQHKWNLKYLKISFKNQVSIVKIRTLLNHLKDTLTSLVLMYKGPDYDPSLPIEDNWVIPLSMKYLKHLEISPNVFSNSCRFLINALQLPNLKYCKFSSTISWNDNYFDAMWTRNRIGRWRQPCLEILEIPCSCLDASIFLQQPNPFRNLKELVLDSPSIKVMQAIFLAQTNLERLKIYELYSLSNYTWVDITDDYFHDLKRRPLIWDEILTGNKRPEYTIMYNLRAEPLVEAASSIRNLSKLKFLLLDFKSSNEKVSDFFIYHGLMSLKQLQHIDINSHTFTDEAIMELRKQLCQFCHLELGDFDEEDF